MKVMCRCCHKLFDYDMFMGLCPKCGRVYRRGREAYSQVERDMLGEFHIDGDEGGLNRGIHGVRYNQESDETGKTMLNGFDLREAEMAQNAGYSSMSNPKSKYVQSATSYSAKNNAASYQAGTVAAADYQNRNAASPIYQNSAVSSVSSTIQSAANTVTQKVGPAVNDFRNPYYASNHGTRMNQGVTKGRKNNNVGLIVFVVIIVIMILEALT